MKASLEHHRETLEEAILAIKNRNFFSIYPEIPIGKMHGEGSREEAEKQFQEIIQGKAPLKLASNVAGTVDLVSEEVSLYTRERFMVSYPFTPTSCYEEMIYGTQEAMEEWKDVDDTIRAYLSIEILARLHQKSFLTALSLMHTAGPSYVMAFQSGGPHAQDRGLEALAYTHDVMKQIPAQVKYKKPIGINGAFAIDKEFVVQPRGLGFIIACSTSSLWNTYPPLFANLTAGCGTVIKPHPEVVLPLAITVEVIQSTLKEYGFNPLLVQLLLPIDKNGNHSLRDWRFSSTGEDILQHPAIRLIDYAGNKAFGQELESLGGKTGKEVFTEKSGVNTIIVDTLDPGMLQAAMKNLWMSLSLYSGQMATTPQNIFIHEKSYELAMECLRMEAEKLESDPEKAIQFLGVVKVSSIEKNLDRARGMGRVRIDSKRLAVPSLIYPDHRVITPLLVELDKKELLVAGEEFFGPIAFLIPTSGLEESIALAKPLLLKEGALTLGYYGESNVDAIFSIRKLALEIGVNLSINPEHFMNLINFSSAFSDFHGTGSNPAANASFCDQAFVCKRFRVVTIRKEIGMDIS